jgi:hypothetical protein
VEGRLTRTNELLCYKKLLLRKSVFVTSAFLYYYQCMIIQVGVEGQRRVKVVGGIGTEGDCELEGVLRLSILNNLIKCHRLK